MAYSGTFRILNGPTVDEMQFALSGKYADRKTVVFTLLDDLTKGKFLSTEIRIAKIDESGPLGVQLSFTGNCGEHGEYRFVSGSYHATLKTGTIKFEEK